MVSFPVLGQTFQPTTAIMVSAIKSCQSLKVKDTVEMFQNISGEWDNNNDRKQVPYSLMMK